MRVGCALALLLLTAAACRSSTPPPPPPPEVLVAPVLQRDVPIYSEWIGTTDGFVNAQIRARVSGYLQSRHYVEGSAVKAGDLMFVIDPRPYQATLDAAVADLRQAEARLKKTEQDVARYAPLAAQGAVSQEELDNAVQSRQAALADVDARRAAVTNAELNVAWTRVTAPIDGIAGFAVAQVGDLIQTDTALTTVSQVQPIKAEFPISEREYLGFADRIANAMQAEVRGEEHGPGLELVLSDGTTYPHRGRFALANRQVDVKTGAILIQALFPNPGDVLRPGLYAKVRAPIDIAKDALLVPQRAVQELQGVYQVAVVKPDDTIDVRRVTPGARVGRFWVITKGLATRESVVVEGVQKVGPGVKVVPKSAPAEMTSMDGLVAPSPTPVPESAPAARN
jgi:membrane fusion protein (multidrug efflux system)